MQYRLIIFDFDGVLADSAGWVLRELNPLARRFGFREVSDEEVDMLRGKDNREIVRYLRIPAWKLPFIARHMRKRVADAAHTIGLFEGAPRLLHGLAGSGVELAIVSSNSEANIRRILGDQLAGLIAHYDCGAGLFGKAAKFRRLVRRTGVRASQVLCVGDEVRDIEAAADAGLASAAVAWGYAKRELLAARRPAHIFATADEMLTTLTA
jgi:phosphoglycolate phosphatase